MVMSVNNHYAWGNCPTPPDPSDSSTKIATTAWVGPHISEKWTDGTNWWRKYSDGWIEQGGVFTSTAGTSQIFTFPLSFASTQYYMFATNYQVTDAGICVFAATPYTKTQCQYCTAYNGTSYAEQFRWFACGY